MGKPQPGPAEPVRHDQAKPPHQRPGILTQGAHQIRLPGPQVVHRVVVDMVHVRRVLMEEVPPRVGRLVVGVPGVNVPAVRVPLVAIPPVPAFPDKEREQVRERREFDEDRDQRMALVGPYRRDQRLIRLAQAVPSRNVHASCGRSGMA